MKAILLILTLLGSSSAFARTSGQLFCIVMVDGKSIFEINESSSKKPKVFEMQIIESAGTISVVEQKNLKDAKPVGMFQISYAPKKSAGLLQVMMKSFREVAADISASSYIVPDSEAAFDLNAAGGLFGTAVKSASVCCKLSQ